MANKSVKLHVITPSKMFYEGDIELVIVRTHSGEEGFMANHAWGVKLLDVGKLWIKEFGAKEFKVAAVSGGFIDVMDEIVIYTDSAEWPEDIDTERAAAEKTNAEEWLLENKNNKDTDPEDIARAKVSVARQNVRVSVANNENRRGK